MAKDERSIGKNIIWNSVGTLFYFGCQWLLTVLVVRLNNNYSSAGILALAMSIATPLITVATLNLRTFQVANMDECFSDGDFIFTRTVTSIAALAICIILVVCGKYSNYTSICIILFMCYRLSEAIIDVLHGIDQRAWRLDLAGKSSLLRGSIMLAAFVVGEYCFKNLLVSIVLMGLAVYSVILCYDIPACKRCTQLNLAHNRGNIFSLVKVGIPLGASSFLLGLLSSIPRLFMENWYGEEALGLFGSITTITVLVPQFANFIFGPLVPLFAERWKSGDVKGFNRLLAANVAGIALIGAMALIVGYFFGEWGLSLIFGDSIRPYSYLLCPVIGTAIITAYIWLLVTVLTILGDYNMLAWIGMVSVVVCVIASACLIKESAFIGTVLATTVGLSLECILHGIRVAILIFRKMKTGKRTGW